MDTDLEATEQVDEEAETANIIDSLPGSGMAAGACEYCGADCTTPENVCGGVSWACGSTFVVYPPFEVKRSPFCEMSERVRKEQRASNGNSNTD